MFGEDHRIIKKPVEFSLEEVVNRAKAFERAGANAIFLMSTANYDFNKFLKIGKAVKKAVSPRIPLVANIGDFGPEEASRLVEAGFTAVYHVVRLGEGRDTKIDPKRRVATIKDAQDAGLTVGYCGAAVGSGIVVGILTKATPLTGKERALVNLASSEALKLIADGGGRCCKRAVRQSIEACSEFLKKEFEISLPYEKPVCTFYKRNKECLKEKCPYMPKKQG